MADQFGLSWPRWMGFRVAGGWHGHSTALGEQVARLRCSPQRWHLPGVFKKQPGTGTSRMQPSPSQPGPWLYWLSPSELGKKGTLIALKHLLIHPLCSQDVVRGTNHSSPGFLGTETGQILHPAGVWVRDSTGDSLLGQEGQTRCGDNWGCPQPLRGSQHLPCPAPSPLGLLNARGRGKGRGWNNPYKGLI